MSYRDLRAFLEVLEARGMVHRFKRPVDKDRELGPLLRVQLRGVPEAERKVLLFEDVRGASGEQYPMQVLAGVYGFSEEIVALGMGCRREEMLERWHQGLEHPIEPVLVDSGPVQEEIHLGEDLLGRGLDELPAPVEEPGFSQVIRTGVPMISRDPESGIRNVGTYNGFFRDRDRICAGIAPMSHAVRYHWQTARRRGEPLPIAIVVGCTPNIMLVGSASIPYGVDELAVAGGITGEPIELVPCKTVPLEVPAHAEIVIEGLLAPDTLEPRMAFGEYPGHMQVERNVAPVMQVTAITHRADALFTPVLVGFPPNDSNIVSSVVEAATAYHYLRYQCHLPIEEIYFPEPSPATFGIVRLQRGATRNVWQVLQATAGLAFAAKYLIAVDHDVDPRDPDLLIWALTWRVRPESDIVVVRGRRPGLDPSFGRAGSSTGRMDAGGPSNYFRVLIDATMTGPYPPVALPKQEYMERALTLWRAEGLPEPQLRAPWYGYSLGYWSEEDQRLADLMVAGDYKAVGRIARDMQVQVEQVLRGDGAS
jgi:4-hydroxy-3-polyprenylbenzoate decarboxylase